MPPTQVGPAMFCCILGTAGMQRLHPLVHPWKPCASPAAHARLVPAKMHWHGPIWILLTKLPPLRPAAEAKEAMAEAQRIYNATLEQPVEEEAVPAQ